MSHFEKEDDPRVEKARAPLFNPLLSKVERRLHLRQNWKEHLRVVSGGSDRVVCLTCACKIYTCSRALLCPQPSRLENSSGRSKAEANSARATVNVSVAAWFYSLMETLDVMPDTGYYQVQVGKKNMLYDNYMLDVHRWPTSTKSGVRVSPVSSYESIADLQNVSSALTRGTSSHLLQPQRLRRQTHVIGCGNTSTGHSRVSAVSTTPRGMRPSGALKRKSQSPWTARTSSSTASHISGRSPS